MNFKVISADNPKEWDHVLSKMTTFDFYHTSLYHRLDGSGEPRLLVFSQDDKMMAIPLIFRKIPKSNLADVTSVYGYAGWVRNHPDTFPETFTVLKEYFREEKIVSAFSRLHPLISGSDHFECGIVENLNKTCGIDLMLPERAQWMSYSESVRRSIRKSTKAGMTVRLAETDEDVRNFIALYKKAMSLLKASPNYFFSDEYFFDLIQSPDLNAFLLIAELDGQMTGGAIFVATNQFLQYHLGAISEEYKTYSPLKLLIDKARLIGKENHRLSVFHLGGGYGGQNDNLYVFKSRMTTLRYVYKIWKWVVDEENYEILSGKVVKSAFFPLYRV